MVVHYDFVSKIPESRDGQINWIIKKSQERLNTSSVCTDCLKGFQPVKTVNELYEKVSEVCDDSTFWGN